MGKYFKNGNVERKDRHSEIRIIEDKISIQCLKAINLTKKKRHGKERKEKANWVFVRKLLKQRHNEIHYVQRIAILPTITVPYEIRSVAFRWLQHK